MKTTFLNSVEDMAWLAEVHTPLARLHCCALIEGNEDSPERISLYVRQKGGCKPTVLVPKDNKLTVEQWGRIITVNPFVLDPLLPMGMVFQCPIRFLTLGESLRLPTPHELMLLRNHMKKHGQLLPVSVEANGLLFSGFQRYHAARSLHWSALLVKIDTPSEHTITMKQR